MIQPLNKHRGEPSTCQGHSACPHTPHTGPTLTPLAASDHPVSLPLPPRPSVAPHYYQPKQNFLCLVLSVLPTLLPSLLISSSPTRDSNQPAITPSPRCRVPLRLQGFANPCRPSSPTPGQPLLTLQGATWHPLACETFVVCEGPPPSWVSAPSAPTSGALINV